MVICNFGEYDFKKDISKGLEAEEYISKLILERDNTVLKILPNENSKYDRMIIFKDGTFCTIEVKNDILSAKTNNVAVEISCRGEESGVFSSEADYFVYFIREKDETKIYIIRRLKLIELISIHKLKTVNGGDMWNGKPSTKMILVPKDMFKSSCIDITNRKKYLFGIRRNLKWLQLEN